MVRTPGEVGGQPAGPTAQSVQPLPPRSTRAAELWARDHDYCRFPRTLTGTLPWLFRWSPPCAPCSLRRSDGEPWRGGTPPPDFLR